jgi:LmeA-like phospholipid-binding
MARRHRTALIFVGVVLLLAGLLAAGLYGADRWAQQRIERQAAKNLQSALATPAEPGVSIDGFPFLSQVATRNVRQVHVAADDLGITADNALGVAHLNLLLTDVMTTDWFETMTASHVEGTALIDYAALGRVATVPLSYAGEGRIRMETTTTLFGTEVVAQITGSPRLEPAKQTVMLADPTIKVADVNLPDFAATALLRTVIEPIPLKGLPLGLTATSVAAEADALRIGVAADNVPLQA